MKMKKKEQNKKERKKKEKKKERTEGEISDVFIVTFKERKNASEKGRKKESTNHVMCGLPHRKGKEKKADKLPGKQADVTTERLLQFLSMSAWLWIFWIYINSDK